MSRNSKNAKRRILAKEVTAAHKAGHRFGKLANENGVGKSRRYLGKSQKKRESMAGITAKA